MVNSPQSKVDRLYMQAAYRLAEKGLFTVTRNNPRVGCLIVKDYQVVGRGWHEKDGGPHAEVMALNQAGSNAKGGTVYVTLEPCCFEGRTGPCTEALLKSQVERVVIGAKDYHPQVKGKGVAKLKELGLTVKEMGFPAETELNVGCRFRHRRRRPYVRLKLAMSLDGRTAMASGDSKWITGESARRDVQYWRGRSGAILTGIGTVLADDPMLTVRESRYQGCIPWRVVFDTYARLPVNAAMLKHEGRIVLVCGSEATAPNFSREVDIWQQPTSEVALNSVINQLAEEGVNEVLVEAGSTLVGSFVERNLWDEMIVYVGPTLLGKAARPLVDVDIESMESSLKAKLLSVEQFDEDLRLVFKPAPQKTATQ